MVTKILVAEAQVRNRLGFLTLVVVALVAAILTYSNVRQPENSLQVVGVINHGAIADPALDGFRDGLTKLGYRNGVDITYFYDGATGSAETVHKAAEAIMKHKPTLLLALSTPAALAAQKVAEGKIPVIFAPSANPVGAGLVDSLKQPGRNTTGVSFGRQEGRRLEWLAVLAPNIKRILFPYNPDDKSPVAALEVLHPAAEKLGVELVLDPLKTPEDVERRINDLPHDIDAIFIPTDAMVATKTNEFTDAAKRRGIPVSTVTPKGVAHGALMSFGFSGLYDLGFQAARLADQIFKGVPAGDLPVEIAEFKLSINMDTAKDLGLTIPDAVLRQAILMGKDFK